MGIFKQSVNLLKIIPSNLKIELKSENSEAVLENCLMLSASVSAVRIWGITYAVSEDVNST